MECKAVRERFSSFLEAELNPEEEREVKDHLHGCPKCQRELEGFEKMLRWLHSIEEVEIPEGFLPEIYKKVEEREKKGLFGKKFKWRGGGLFHSIKIPIQAVAMVAVVFLVLYLTKMIPGERYYQRSLEKTPTSQLERRTEDERLIKSIDEVPPAPETKKGAYQTAEKKDKAMSDSTPLKSGVSARVKGEESKQSLALTVSKEIALKITDQKEALAQLNELIKKFGGELVEIQKDFLYASLPLATFLEFEEELKGWGSVKKEEKVLLSKENKVRLSSPSIPEPKGLDEKDLPETTPQKDRIYIKIHLVQE